MKPRVVALLVVVLVLGWFLWPARVRRHPPGALVTRTPALTRIENGKPWKCKEYLITPLADYEIEARILARARYWMGRESELSSYDLAVGWGVMSDQRVVDELTISQSDRWYSYEWSGDPPAIPSEMAIRSKNMHIVAANGLVERAVSSCVVGDVVALKGKLVEARSTDGWSWRSALDDEATGARSCKVYWVESWTTR